MDYFRGSFVSCVLDLVLLVLLFVNKTVGIATCYMRNGMEASYLGVPYTPCTSEANSACCYSRFDDICTLQGLCSSVSTGLFIDGCTDPTWELSACSHLCPDFAAGVSLRNCVGGSYCCSSDPSDNTCCNTTTQFYIDVTGNPVYKFAITGTSIITAIVGTSTTTITTVAAISSSSQSLVSTTAVTPTSSSSASSSPRPSTGSAALSPGATAGLGVGIALTILLLAGLISLYLWQRYRRRANEGAAIGPMQIPKSSFAQPINHSGTPEIDSREIRELEGVGERRA